MDDRTDRDRAWDLACPVALSGCHGWPSPAANFTSSVADTARRLLEGVGHLFFWEQPQRSAELVRGFALDARVLSSA